MIYAEKMIQLLDRLWCQFSGIFALFQQ